MYIQPVIIIPNITNQIYIQVSHMFPLFYPSPELAAASDCSRRLQSPELDELDAPMSPSRSKSTAGQL